MKKVLIGIAAGLAAGVALTAWLLPRQAGSPPATGGTVAPPAAAEHGAGVHLTPEQQGAAGLVLGSPTIEDLPAETKAYGRVLDPAPLLAALTEVQAARVDLTSAEQEFARAKKLNAEGENVSTQVVETTGAAVERDRLQLEAARGRLVAGWGDALAARADLPALVQRLLSQQAALVRLDALPDESSTPAPTGLRIRTREGEPAPRPAELLGPAPAADSQVQGAAYLAVVRGPPLPVGSALVGYLTLNGPAKKAVAVPHSAVLYHEGSTWVYVLAAKDTFQRRRVVVSRNLADRVALSEGVAAGDRVLTVGAQQLLSSELQAAGGEGD